jgi:hypothetical protein
MPYLQEYVHVWSINEVQNTSSQLSLDDNNRDHDAKNNTFEVSLCRTHDVTQKGGRGYALLSLCSGQAKG